MGLILPKRIDDLLCLRSIDHDHNYFDRPADYLRLAPRVAMHREVFLDESPWERELLRAVAASRNSYSAVVTGRHAARLWGFHVYSPNLASYEDPVPMVLPGNTRPAAKAKQPKHAELLGTVLPADEFGLRDGVRIAAPWRAVRDIILHDPQPLAGLVALESMRNWAKGNDAAYVNALIGQRRYKGKAAVRALVERSVTTSDSALETWGRYLLEEANLPGVHSIEPQVRFDVNGRTYYVDLLVNGWLIIEFDGNVKYRGENAEMNLVREAQRQHDLLNSGRSMLRVSHADLESGRFLVMVVDALQRFPQTTKS